MIKDKLGDIEFSIKNISDYEIWNGEEWCDFSGIMEKNIEGVVTLKFSDDSSIQGSLNHKIQVSSEFKYIKDINIGDIINKLTVTNKTINTKSKNKLYDILGVEKGNKYLTNSIISHNCAFLPHVDEIWTSTQQTLATGGRCIALSTPNGVGNWFHKTWSDAEAGINNFNFIRLPWTVHPERDQKWRDAQTVALGEKMAAQECDADFISSGNTVIDMKTLKIIEDYFVIDPIEKRYSERLWIWEYPDPNKRYLVAADVARGDGSDYSACHVLDIATLEQVAEFKGLMGTTDYGNLLVSLGHEYNGAMLVVENASIGWAVIQVIIDREYPSIYYTAKDFKVVDKTKDFKEAYEIEGKGKKKSIVPGFTTSSRTRPLIIEKLTRVCEDKNEVIRIHSKRLIDELTVFVWKTSGKAEARSGYNDDLVMSFAIGLWVRDTAIKLVEEGISVTKYSLNATNKTDIFSGTNTGGDTKDNPWIQQTGYTGVEIDLKEFL